MITKAFDSAFPPYSTPPGCQAVMGYVGRPNFTPHVWTLAEWGRFAAIPQLPIWVPDLAADPVAEAKAAMEAVLAIGWSSHQKPERVIIFDLETSIARAWYADCAAEVQGGGFTPMLYGSLSSVLQNAAADVLVAAWDDTAKLLPGQTMHGHQFQAGVGFDGALIDYSVIDEWTLERAGVGPRHA